MQTVLGSFMAGLFAAFLFAGTGGLKVSTASADHLDVCFDAGWSEIVKENNDHIEDGNRGEVKVNYPDGGPTANDGALVKHFYVWFNVDNWAEVGWNWRDGIHTEPRRFWARTDAGNYGEDANDGPGGARGTWHDYKVDNTTGTTWTALNDGTQYHSYTFANLTEGEPLAGSEVNRSCDDAEAHYRNLKDKESNTAAYGSWVQIQNSLIGTDNPCFQVEILSNTAFDVVHSGGSC